MGTIKYEILPANKLFAFDLAANMRAGDREEVMASMGKTPLEAVMHSISQSVEAWVGLADEKVLCAFGVAPVSALTSQYTPWMLSSTELPKHWREFARRSVDVVEFWLANYPTLLNYVDARYTAAIRWLKWLGFKVADEPTILNGYLFYQVRLGD